MIDKELNSFNSKLVGIVWILGIWGGYLRRDQTNISDKWVWPIESATRNDSINKEKLH